MNLYNFYKVFRHGDKAGKRSKNPTAGIPAYSEDEAWEKFKEHPKYKAKIDYICVNEGIAGAEEMPSAGQKKPGEWSVGDKCWTRLNPLDPEDTTYHEGVIMRINTKCLTDGPLDPDNVDTKNLVYSVWLTGDYASWRVRSVDQILLQPPKGKRRRRRNRPSKAKAVKPVKTIRRKK